MSKSDRTFITVFVTIGVLFFAFVLAFVGFADEVTENEQDGCIVRVHKEVSWFDTKEITVTKFCKE